MPTEQNAIDAFIKNDFEVVQDYLKSYDINKIMMTGTFGGGYHVTSP